MKSTLSVDVVLEILRMYQQKYGKPPKIIEVHMPTEEIKLSDGMQVVIRAQRYILPMHYWAGEED